MTVRIEKSGKVWTVVHSRAAARNAMDPASADALVDAFVAFDRDPEAAVAVLWGEGGAFCAGWDLKYCASLLGQGRPLEDIAYPLDERVRWLRRQPSPARARLRSSAARAG